MIATPTLLAVLAMATATPSPELAPVSPAVDPVIEQAVTSYYQTRHARYRPILHAMKHVGQRQHRNQPVELVCVSLTFHERFTGQQSYTEALLLAGTSVERRITGFEALSMCSVV